MRSSKLKEDREAEVIKPFNTDLCTWLVRCRFKGFAHWFVNVHYEEVQQRFLFRDQKMWGSVIHIFEFLFTFSFAQSPHPDYQLTNEPLRRPYR